MASEKGKGSPAARRRPSAERKLDPFEENSALNFLTQGERGRRKNSFLSSLPAMKGGGRGRGLH